MKIKKKLLIYQTSMRVGGTEKSLLNFVNYFKYDFDIDVLIGTRVQNDETMIKSLEDVNVVFLNSKIYDLMFGIVDWSNRKKVGICDRFLFFMIKILSKLGLKNKIIKWVASKKKNILSNYDYYLVYNIYQPDGPLLLSHYTKRMLALVHGDPQNHNYNFLINNFNDNIKFLAVSKGCAELMKQTYPNIKDLDYLNNFFNKKEVLVKKDLFCPKYNKNVINLVTAARLVEQKAYMRSLSIFKKLINEGYVNFCWNIIGDGCDREKIEGFIRENNMENFVTLHGNQTNPFPYMKGADLFYLGSYHEVAPMVYAESMTCGTPVLSTEICNGTASDMIGDYGFVCENNEKAIYNALKEILDNPKLIEEKRKLLINYEYDNEKIKQQFMKIIGEI